MTIKEKIGHELKAQSQAKKEVDEANQYIQEGPVSIAEHLKYHKPIECAYHLDLGGWKCESSPTGQCVYDDRHDSLNDHCIFCGDPDERK